MDATTPASIMVDGDLRYGTTEYIANMIAEKVGGDLHRIETVTPYTADFDELRDVNHDEMNRNYLPELKKVIWIFPLMIRCLWAILYGQLMFCRQCYPF